MPDITAPSALAALLAPLAATLNIHLRQYHGARCCDEILIPGDAVPQPVTFAGATWRLGLVITPYAQDGVELRLTAEILAGQARDVSFGWKFLCDRWARENYVFFPAAAYNGNRYHTHSTWRTEGLPNLGPNPDVLITNVPRLNIAEGPSRIQLLTGDLTTPAVAFQSAGLKHALILLTDQGSELGNTGLSLTENDARTQAELLLMAPGVREEVRYNGRPSTDRGATLAAGQTVTLRCILHVFPAPDIQSLFDRFFDLRNELRGQARRREDIPFSSTWAIQERKYNEQNWVEKYGYYSVGMRESPPQDWQTGWVGGPNAVYPLLAEGDAITQRRAARTFDFLFNTGLAPSGFFRGCFHEGKWNENHYRRTFLRYSADSLYFIAKCFILLQQRHGPEAVASTWLRGLRQVADAFVRIWDKYGQLGHYAREDRDELAIGGTCAAATAPGGLALAARLFHEPRYLEVAQASALYYHKQFVRIGLTNGGPGDIVQCPDSESCYGLLESFTTLLEETGDPAWLVPAREVAAQAATWVVTYDFKFPPTSTFGKLDMLTTGTVFANVQNKHSAPGLCSLSGCSLLRLFRATADQSYLRLIEEIAHAIPQYMSRQDRPITDRRPNQRWPVMPPGWINERVNMSDWEVRGEPDEEIGVGEIFGGSTWAEVAMLLTWAELPGLYAQPDTRLLCALDHVTARWTGSEDAPTIEIHNPTRFPADVKVLWETAVQARTTPLGPTPTLNLPRVAVAPGATVVWKP